MPTPTDPLDVLRARLRNFWRRATPVAELRMRGGLLRLAHLSEGTRRGGRVR